MNGGRRVRVSEERVVLASDALEDLEARLARTRISPDLASGWELGVPGYWLRRLLEDWRGFDTGAVQQQLDGLPQLRAEVDGQMLHVVHVEGRGPNPVPLLLTHGWPGSFLEYLELLPMLCNPGAHGADPADASHGDRAIVPRLRI